MPELGDLFAIPLRHRWWGAAKLLSSSKTTGHTFLVLDGFWRSVPTPGTFHNLTYVKNAFGGSSHHQDEWKAWFDGGWPETFSIIHNLPLTEYEQSIGGHSGTTIYQSSDDFAHRLHDFRLWKYEPDTYSSRSRRKVRTGPVSAQLRKESLTLEKMARERPFGNWQPFWPEEVINEARRIFCEATRELIALDRQATPEAKTSILRGIVDSFNDLEERIHCIETPEREQVIERIEELAELVSLTNGPEETLTSHRIW